MVKQPMRPKYSKVCGVMPRLILLLVLSGLMATLAFIFYVSPMYSNLEPEVVTRSTTPSASEEVSPKKSREALYGTPRRRRELEEKHKSLRRQRPFKAFQKEQPVVKLRRIPINELQERFKTIQSSADFVRIFTEQDLSDQQIYSWMSSYEPQASPQSHPQSHSTPSKRFARAARAKLSKSTSSYFAAAPNDSEASTSQRTSENSTNTLLAAQNSSIDDSVPGANKSVLTTENSMNDEGRDNKTKLDQAKTNSFVSEVEQEWHKAYDQLKKFVHSISEAAVSDDTKQTPLNNNVTKDNYRDEEDTLARDSSTTTEETPGSPTSELFPDDPLENSSAIHELFSSGSIPVNGSSSTANSTIDEEIEVDSLQNATADNLNIVEEDLKSTTIINSTNILKVNASEEKTANKDDVEVTTSPVTESVDRKIHNEHKLSKGSVESPNVHDNNSTKTNTTATVTTTAIATTNTTTTTEGHFINVQTPDNHHTDTIMTKPRGKTPEEYNWDRLENGLHLEVEEAFLAAAYRLDDTIFNRDEYACQKPSKFVKSVSHPYLTNIMLIPDCVLLHRCMPYSGCCHGPSQCGPKTIEVVHIPFWVLTIYDQRARLQPDRALFLSFVNHTECTCLVDEGYSKTATSCEKQCPHPFQLARVGHSCVCDCLNNGIDSASLQYCEEIKHGARPVLAHGADCIKKGNCNEPECEMGVFNISTNYCPLSNEYALPSHFLKHKHGGNPRHYREHLRLPSIPSPPPPTPKPNSTNVTSSQLGNSTAQPNNRVDIESWKTGDRNRSESSSQLGNSTAQPNNRVDVESWKTGDCNCSESSSQEEAPDSKKSSAEYGPIKSSSMNISTDKPSAAEAHSEKPFVTDTQPHDESILSETVPGETLDPSLPTLASPVSTGTDIDKFTDYEENDTVPYIDEELRWEYYDRYQFENLNDTQFLDDEV